VVGLVPFSAGVNGTGIISSGLSSAGYDLRLGANFRCYTGGPHHILDPLNLDPELWKNVRQDQFYMLEPRGFVLGESLEEITMPDDCLAIALGKSTYARVGVLCNTTPAEPGWRGKLTIEISNLTGSWVKLRVWHGICQMIFLRCEDRPEKTYADKQGKYQNQTGVTLAK